MILGIKVGPQKDSFRDLDKANPPFAEVWFNILRKNEYTDLFRELKRRTMKVGLHFWGHLPDHTWTNIALPENAIVEPSMAQLKETIDIAYTNGFQYVVFHPSTRIPVKIYLDDQRFVPQGDPIPEEDAQRIFLDNLTILTEYANERNIILAIETIPSRDTNGWYSPNKRDNPFNIFNLENTVVIKAAERGFAVANDFGHTACAVLTTHRSLVWSTVVQITKKLFHQTKILHLGYIIPPYNGTDFHDHLDNPFFETDHAVPNKQEMKDLLRMFKDRDDVYVLVEPNGRHVENYTIAKRVIDSL